MSETELLDEVMQLRRSLCDIEEYEINWAVGTGENMAKVQLMAVTALNRPIPVAAPSPGTGTAAVATDARVGTLSVEYGDGRVESTGLYARDPGPAAGPTETRECATCGAPLVPYRTCINPDCAGPAAEPGESPATKCKRWCGTGKFPAKGAYYQTRGVYYCTESCAHVARTTAAEPGKPASCETCNGSGYVRHVGYGNDEVVEDCPSCTARTPVAGTAPKGENDD